MKSMKLPKEKLITGLKSGSSTLFKVLESWPVSFLGWSHRTLQYSVTSTSLTVKPYSSKFFSFKRIRFVVYGFAEMMYGQVLTLSAIVKHFMASASDDELVLLFMATRVLSRCVRP